jgi:hypothetical protein
MGAPLSAKELATHAAEWHIAMLQGELHFKTFDLLDNDPAKSCYC